ncbi:isoprenylcysteine carboxylmethyltransferase family protein [Chitinibacter bivalviorum]|uniref:Isoprenylcysteine carboxylmethyltransferase family protein n=1 Tax=Chitinibacter bivalviorum TaxID=2739434 RepID=A0A7H9BF67_9NEIS|nr:isoprenylcysteine carboxylmethyltransferase family protein [Chitinibacter bivalviorum]QLG87217.1 isoprenylcysteine carboxylmethyltransferase family protein [Chitinibacter bivalviorum]
MLKHLELKIMPMALVLIIAILQAGLAAALPQLNVQLPLNGPIGLMLIMLGIAVVLAGGHAFRRAQTTFDPRQPKAASQLVQRGIYAYSRNPMYLGFLLVLIGWADWQANLAAFTLLPLFVGYLNRFQIAPEEQAMRELFGAEFDAYCAKVRRWL